MSAISLRLRVIIGFAVIVGLLAATSLIAVSQLGSLDDAEATIAEHEAPFNIELQRGAIYGRDANGASSTILIIIMVSSTLQKVVAGFTGGTYVEDPSSLTQYKEEYKTNFDLARASFEKAKDFTAGNQARIDQLESIDSLLVSYDESLQKLTGATSNRARSTRPSSTS